MHNDFLYKLPQQSRGKFFKAGMPPDNIHKLFSVHGGFLRFGKLRLESGNSFFQFFLLGFIVCRQFCETLVRYAPGHAVLIQPLEDSG